MKVCICKNVSDRAIRNAVADGACSLDELRAELGIATQCGKCSMLACEVIHEALANPPEMIALGATAVATA